MNMKHTPRFVKFRHALRQQLGNFCEQLPDGRIVVYANEFSPTQTLRSLQAAIDHYARYMPDDLKQA